jgi:hypothetical protein
MCSSNEVDVFACWHESGSRTGWLDPLKLFRQNQFSISRDAQAVFLCLMDDDDFTATIE